MPRGSWGGMGGGPLVGLRASWYYDTYLGKDAVEGEARAAPRGTERAMGTRGPSWRYRDPWGPAADVGDDARIRESKPFSNSQPTMDSLPHRAWSPISFPCGATVTDPPRLFYFILFLYQQKKIEKKNEIRCSFPEYLNSVR